MAEGGGGDRGGNRCGGAKRLMNDGVGGGYGAGGCGRLDRTCQSLQLQ
jgi:hypothetical protein